MTSALTGLSELERRFNPPRKVVDGSQDVSLDEFVSAPADYWIDAT